ncbi:MAG: glycerol-3-phosphate dehydrogenase [Pseudomonadales bacterium]|nr:glycerol-3-phosphate dehydrogenase [Pseudomonadales bacterium]
MTNAVTHISPKNAEHANIYDLFIVGGGVNGTGIAADAQGRGLSVMLCEQSDLASATSSASSKLIHGGLRYLEHYEFRLVREALAEREVLLNNAPHLIKPLRFVLPHRPHLRPAWMIRIGLFLYDHLTTRSHLPASRGVKLSAEDETNPLNDSITYGFKYSDCRVDDSRLVVSNAISARENGANILTRTRCQSAYRKNGLWHISLEDLDTGKISYYRAKALINASGPWAQKFIETKVQQKSPRGIRLIKGSHLVVPKMYDGEQAYILQNEDQRIVFVIPYNNDFTMIGTTDKEYTGDPKDVAMDNEEEAYLLDIVNKHFEKQLNTDDVVWSWSGVRPLCDDESDSPSAITRDYTLELEADDDNKAPMLSIFGGKITTYRKLSEAAVATLEPFFPNMAKAWTRNAPLPGGDLGEQSFAQWQQALTEKYAWLSTKTLERLTNAYGTRVEEILADAQSAADLGKDFGYGLFANEVDYLIREEWARSADDILWRRSKMGLYLNEAQKAHLDAYVETRKAELLNEEQTPVADFKKVSG